MALLSRLRRSQRFDSRGKSVRVVGKLRIARSYGWIGVGDGVVIWPDVKLAAWGTPERPARLAIGDGVSIGDRTEIHCGREVTIGAGSVIAWDVVILDRDYHGLDGPELLEPVTFEERVWVGCRAIVLKGVTLGEGSVVAAGSVVTRDVPARAVVAGNPARVVREGVSW